MTCCQGGSWLLKDCPEHLDRDQDFCDRCLGTLFTVIVAWALQVGAGVGSRGADVGCLSYSRLDAYEHSCLRHLCLALRPVELTDSTFVRSLALPTAFHEALWYLERYPK